jgi:uncharacterized protein (DUF924 family)
MILLDQIPRNLYRTPESLKLVYGHYDVLCQSLAHRLLSLNPRPDQLADIRFRPVFRMWFYMPLMHSESRDDHRLLLRILDDVKADMDEKGDEDAAKYVEFFRGFEKTHADIIEKFDRYPHRNACMNREATEEEIKYLEDGGERFGVGG